MLQRYTPASTKTRGLICLAIMIGVTVLLIRGQNSPPSAPATDASLNNNNHHNHNEHNNKNTENNKKEEVHEEAQEEEETTQEEQGEAEFPLAASHPFWNLPALSKAFENAPAYYTTGVEGQIHNVFRKVLQKDDFVVDIGMNHGYFTVLSVTLGATVWSFEPQPDCHKKFAQTLSDRDVAKYVPMSRNMLLFNVAIGNPGTIHVGGGCGGTFGVHGTPSTGKTISVIPLENVIQPNQQIRLIKIDTEGAEVGILQTILPLVEAGRVDNLLAEFMPGNWINRGSNLTEGIDIFDKLKAKAKKVYLLSDPTPFKFDRKTGEVPGVGEACTDFDMGDLFRDRISYDDAPGKGLPHGGNMWLQFRD